jgi:hypothetical protein
MAADSQEPIAGGVRPNDEVASVRGQREPLEATIRVNFASTCVIVLRR